MCRSMGRWWIQGWSWSSCFLVIPGCAPWRRPGIHTHDGGYGFRVRCFASPRNDGGLFRRRLERAEIAERHVGQRIGEVGEIGSHLREPVAAFAPPLIHVD